MLCGLALGGQLAIEAVACVARLALALRLAQMLLIDAVGMNVTDIGSLKGFQ